MRKKYKILFSVLLVLTLAFCALLLWQGSGGVVMNPKGMIAHKERNLIIISTLLMLIVIVPVFLMTVFFSWKYRKESKAKYSPDWDRNHIAEAIWWGVPFIIIAILSVIVWKSSHELDPFQPIKSDKEAVKIQAVALDWKWLFLYPEQKIAAVNFVQFPEQTPINFEVTADAPMNSFWIPQLSGQIYAMPGMRSKLHMIANALGDFRGSSSNFSGKGFSGMVFKARASTQAEFEEWVHSIQHTASPLTLETYTQLAEPSENNPVVFYTLPDSTLFDQIIMKFMMPHE